jgi:hypothetical protein
MVEIRIVVHSEKAIADLKELYVMLPDWNELGLKRAAEFVRGVVQKHYLRGPRPEKLGVRTSRLHDSVDKDTKREGRDTRAWVGTNALSDEGYNYPSYWEYDGSKHGGPRPFLRPAVEEHKEQWIEVWRKGIETHLNKFVGGK